MTAPGQKNGPLSQADLQAIWEGACDSSFVQPMEAAGEGAGFEAYTQMFAQFARASAAIDVTTQALYILPSSGQTNHPAPRANKATVQLTFQRSARSAYTSWPLVIAAGTTFVVEQAFEWGATPGTQGIPVQTGRRYLVTQTLVIPPGDSSAHSVIATAEFPGYGYNNPLGAYKTAGGIQVPGSINLIAQPGTGYSHDRASLLVSPAGAPLAVPASGTPTPSPAVATLIAVNEPDMFLPQHVGQYLLMTAGVNAGKVGRIAGYVPPGTYAPGSAVILAYDQVVELTGVTGTYAAGEVLQFKSGGSVVALGTVLGAFLAPSGATRLVYTLQAGAVSAGLTVVGTGSTATGTISTLLDANVWTAAGVVPPNPNLSPGSGENWRVLDWVTDLQLTVQNLLPPAGGTSAMLDELAYERGVSATNGESADTFRQRVAAPADTVSPNAVRRAITRGLGGSAGLMLDTQTGLDGFFYDRADAGGCFYDTCCLIMTQTGFTSPIPGDRLRWLDANGLLVAQGYYGPAVAAGTFNFILRGGPENILPKRTSFQAGDTIVDDTRPFVSATLSAVQVPVSFSSMKDQVYLDFLDFRGFFLVGLPPSGAGEFGFAWGTSPSVHDGGFFDQKGQLAGFYDGSPVLARGPWGTVFREVTRVHAGGVGFEMYIDPTLLQVFSPSQIDGLVIWLDAQDPGIVLSAGKVVTWPDKSGSGADFGQTIAGRRPVFASSGGINGGPSLHGSGEVAGLQCVSEMVNILGPSATGADRFVVAKLNSDLQVDTFGQQWGPFDNGSYFETQTGVAYDALCSLPSRWGGNAVTPGVLLNTFIQEVQSTDGLFSISYNGVVNFTTAGNTFDRSHNGNPEIWNSEGSGTAMFGYIAEVILFNRILNNIERASVVHYLSAKWGI